MSYSTRNGCDYIINSITSHVVWYSFKTGSVKTIQLKTDQRIDVSALDLRSVIKPQFIVRNCLGLAILLMLIGSSVHVPNDLHLFLLLQRTVHKSDFLDKRSRSNSDGIVGKDSKFNFFFGDSFKKIQIRRKKLGNFSILHCISVLLFTLTHIYMMQITQTSLFLSCLLTTLGDLVHLQSLRTSDVDRMPYIQNDIEIKKDQKID